MSLSTGKSNHKPSEATASGKEVREGAAAGSREQRGEESKGADDGAGSAPEGRGKKRTSR